MILFGLLFKKPRNFLFVLHILQKMLSNFLDLLAGSWKRNKLWKKGWLKVFRSNIKDNTSSLSKPSCKNIYRTVVI